MKILNLGCGWKVSVAPEVINIDWSIYLRARQNPLFRAVSPVFIRGPRRARFERIPKNIMVHDLSKGIPFPDKSVDAVYHSHLFEHLDPPIGLAFMREAHRVLKPRGIHRIVVPDLQQLATEYLEHLEKCVAGSGSPAEHDAFVAEMLEQCVRREASGTSQQRGARRWIENAVLGDARKRGETHQWMYDSVNLGHLLEKAGFEKPTRRQYQESAIPGWADYGLELNDEGKEYKHHSLYLEASTPRV